MTTAHTIWNDVFTERLIEDGLLTKTPYPKPGDIAVMRKEGRIVWVGTLERNGFAKSLSNASDQPITIDSADSWNFFYKISANEAHRYYERINGKHLEHL